MADRDLVAARKAEIVQFVNDFYASSYNWRSQSFHAKWDRRENNYRSIYDPDIKAKKEPWQSVMFDPLTVTNVEVIATALTKILLSKKDAIGFDPRESGDEMQAELLNSLLSYELDRSAFSITSQDALRQCAIFGSSFTKIYWTKKIEQRRVRERSFEKFSEAMKRGRALPKETGENIVVKDVTTREGVHVEMVPIRDIFLPPNATDMNIVLHRNKVTYGELVRLSQMKNANGDPLVDKDSVAALKDVREDDNFEEDVAASKHNQGIYEEPTPTPVYGRKHTVWEYWGLVPRKWVDLGMKESDEAEELVPGKLLIASGKFFLATEENPTQSMTPPFEKMDYIRTGQTYGMGVCQLLEGLQEEINEIRNSRVDNVNMIIHKIFVVLEKYLVDPKDLRAEPMAVIRVKGSEVDDWRKVIGELPISDVTKNAYQETFELERKAQEVTAANRVTTGSAGLVRDSNQTLGGMELLKQAAADRFTVYAYTIGRMYMVSMARRYMELIYLNMPDETIQRILGDRPVTIMDDMGQDMMLKRWMLFKRLPPHEVDRDYDLIPFDVFSEENKFAKSQAMKSYGQFLASVLPQWNPRVLAQKIGRLDGLDKNEVDEIIGEMPAQIPTPLTLGQGVPSVSKASKPTMNESPTTPSPMNTGAPL